MRPVNDLIREYAKKNHPYAGPITKDEIAGLVTALRRRFDLTEQESDFSPKSLQLLESKMVDLHQILAEESIIYLEEYYVLLVREIAAYFIQVLMIHSGGEIDNRSPDLWNTQVIIAKPTTVVKGRERKTLPKLIIPAGNSVAAVWDVIDLKKNRPYMKIIKRQN